jgi:hypothetical protein
MLNVPSSDTAMPRTDPDDEASLRVLHHFFERRLADGARPDRPRPCTQERCEDLVSHLVEQTIARAALRRAVQRPLAPDGGTVGPWKETLRAAALTALRGR